MTFSPRNRSFLIPALGLALLVAVSVAAIAQDDGRVGVLIIAHGAPMPAWNKLPTDLAATVQERLAQDGSGMVARIAFLEFAKPSIADAIGELEAQGIDHIVAVPLFITQSSHTFLDIPCALGLLYHPETLEALKEEGTQPARPKARVILTTTLCCSGLLPQIMLQRAKAISNKPEEEAVVVLAHGSPRFSWPWRENLRKVTKVLREKGGFASARYVFVGTGEGMADKGVAALTAAAKRGKRVLVLGLYVGMGADTIVEGWREKVPAGIKIAAADRGVLPHPAIVDWLVGVAKAAVQERFGLSQK